MLAPLVALAAGVGLVIAPILAIAIATQVSARVLDAGVETPAEKLTQTLLPTLVRGRVSGFLEGTAKRAGAVLGGLIAAALAGAPLAFYAVRVGRGALWLIAAVSGSRASSRCLRSSMSRAHAPATLDVVDDRVIEALVRELDGPRPERAAEVLARLHERGRIDAVPPLVQAAIRSGSPAVWRSLIAVLDTRSEAHGAMLLDAARAATSRVRALAVRAVGLAGGVGGGAVEQWRDGATRGPTRIDPAIALARRDRASAPRGRSRCGRRRARRRRARLRPRPRAAIDELVVEVARRTRRLERRRSRARGGAQARDARCAAAAATSRVAAPRSPRSRASSRGRASGAAPSSRSCAPICSSSCASGSSKARASPRPITRWSR